ncbi:gliding motility-associated C-terminal domain-containing protein [Hymenobacter gummosus]|uniref:Gliding motility-associated C-terminal domain-containing protein n=1 Tax=Hymenobacter gummosus TaxID=1776032 RepID=A0A3S0JFM4_9BACT|nr:gliding motility-associated C-terminal domain-containing protein [Hymenobacter gummosus]RTQ48164.1 gliding motility-associated C-terminal domain-containing protein [Hymenobacter gummosus]
MLKLFLRYGLLLLLLVGLARPQARASHLVGGEMTYRYLGASGNSANPFRYRVTVLIYVNARTTQPNQSSVPLGRPFITVNFFNKSQNGALIRSVNINQLSNPLIVPPGCGTNSAVQIRLCRYEADVDLPVSFDGYYATYTDGTRNAGITNLRNPSDSQQQTIYMEMAPPLLPNSSPTFSDTAVAIVCQGDTSLFLNNAVDPDGDRLIYSFSTPYDRLANPSQFTPPPIAVTYANGFSPTAPFGTGPGNFASLNASTGLARYAVATPGNYVVSVEVKEYRTINGREILVGSTRREIQLVTQTCPPNNTPQFTAATLAQRVFTVEEGQTLSFNVAANDPDNNGITMRANSVLLDGAGGFNATFAGQAGTVLTGANTGSVTISGASGLSGQFRFTPRCGEARATPYDVVLTANDIVNCNSKTAAEVFQIFVTRTPAPVALLGDSIICDAAQVRTYTATGPAPAGGYTWRVTGGTIQGPANGPSIQVQWNTVGAGRVTVRSLSAFGCQSDSATRAVNLRPTINLGVTASSANICLGQSTTLTATGGTTYTFTGGGQPPFIGATYTVSPTQTTTYTVTSGDGTCTTTRTITINVNAVAQVNAGPPTLTVCSGEPTQLGTPALTGYTYQWSPATGLSSATAAQPTLTLTTGTTPTTVRYILLATTQQGCQARDTIVVTVNPAAVARAGADKVICSGESTQIGDAASAVAGSTYQWSPATGLSNATILNPTVTLPNPSTTTPLTQQYILTVRTTAGCVKTDTVRVTVNPLPSARAGATDPTVCSGEPTQLGAAAITGYTYQWSPATGLSSTTVAQPTATLTNTGSTTISQQYIVRVINTSFPACAQTDTVVVNVKPAADARAGATDPVICSGASTQIGATALAGYTYQWSPATGLSSATSAQPTVTLTNPSTTAPLTQQYILTVLNSFGCQDRDTVLVTVNPAVVANAGTPTRTVCSGEAITLGSAALTGYTYQWSPATGLSSATAAQPVFMQTLPAGSAPQTTVYTLTATSREGCTATSQVSVTLNPAVDARAGADVDICSGKSAQLGAAPLTGYTYQWSPATGLSSTTVAQPTVTGTTGATATTVRYILTARTSQGCSRNDTVFVRINPRPENDSIQGSASVCPTVQGVAYSIRNPRSTAYQWIVNGGTIASGQGTAAITVNWGAASSSANVRAYRVNPTTGCSSDTVTFPVRINQILITPRPTGPARVCQADGPYTYQTQLTAGSSYGWQIIGGTQVSTNQASVVINWTRPGLGKIVVTESSNPAGGRCLGTSDTLYVTVLPSPVAQTISGPNRLCAGNAATFSLPSTAGSTYRWALGTTVLASTGNAVTLPAASLPVGTYTLTATETNAQSCAGPVATRTFTVDPLPAAPTVTGPRAICPEGLTGITYSVGTPSSTSTYQWTVVGGTITAGQGTGSVTVSFAAAATTRSVAVTETSQFGCAGPATTITLPLDNATVALRTASVSLTDDRRITLALNVADRTNNTNQVRIMRRNAGSTAAFVQVGTVANSAATYDDATVDADATAYEYRLDLLNSCGTTLGSTNHTTVRLQTTADEQTGKVMLNWNAYQGFTVGSYEVWRTLDGGTATKVATVPAGTLSTELTVGREGFDQVFRIKVLGTGATPAEAWSNDSRTAFENPLAFYNIITPNGDGLNDVFTIKNVELYPGNRIAIFNRWGREVYRTTNYRNTWNGEAQPTGTYYFLFTEASGKVTKGWFEITR